MNTRIRRPEGSSVAGAGRSRTVGGTQPAANAGSPASASSDSVESVHITSAAHQLLSLQQQIAELPAVDVARVEQLRADIAQNKYQIDAGRISDRLLQTERDLQAAGNPAAADP